MFRRLRKYVRELGYGTTDRPRRRYAPSLSTSAAPLENRRLLSAGLGRQEKAAAIHQAVAKAGLNGLDTSPAGMYVISLYESYLLRTPSSAEVDHWVPALRSGT